MREASFDVASMAKTSTKVFVLEVDGTACRLDHRGLRAGRRKAKATRRTSCCFPRSPSTQDRFSPASKQTIKKYGYCVIGVSEGLQAPDGKFLSESGLRDAFGHAQLGGVAPVIANLVHEKLKLKYHWAVADYLQRAARHIASKTDVAQAYAVGKAAVELALKGQQRRHADHRAQVGQAVQMDHRRGRARRTSPTSRRSMPRDYITDDGFHITAKCRAYLSPLIQGEDYPPFKNGLPAYVQLKNVGGAEEARCRVQGLGSAA